ncbi:MAG: hypothetical protein JKY65_25960 [Planctomycetes bacterium]|nr:hypothetical protein [Planctomycetota bacterium]
MNLPRILIGGILLVGLLSSQAAGQACCGVVDAEAPGITGRLTQAAEPPATSRAPRFELKEVRRVLDDLIRTSYPELSRIRYVLYTFKSKTIRFRSNVRIRSLFFGKRVYRIGVNRSVLADPPPPGALRAVLAHELAHTLYYHQRTRGQVIKTARIFFNRRAQIDFELATDLEAARRGFAGGLEEYRRWVEPRLPKAKAAGYAAKYYEAADFVLLGRVARSRPDLLLAWQPNPPRTRAEIEARWLAARARSKP